MASSRLGPGLRDLEKLYGSGSTTSAKLHSNLSLGEIGLCVILGTTAELSILQSYRAAVSTALLCAMSMMILLRVRRYRGILPVKIFYVDYPVISLTAFGAKQFISSGGGGGLAYGVEDTTRIMEIQNGDTQPLSGLPVNLFTEHNAECDQGRANELSHTELLLGEGLPMSLLWGMSACPSRRLFAGGLGGDLLIARQKGANSHNPIETILRHGIVDRSNPTKKSQIVNHTVFSPSGRLVAMSAENGAVRVYAINPFAFEEEEAEETLDRDLKFSWETLKAYASPVHCPVVLLGSTTLTEAIAAQLAITDDEKWLIVLTTNGLLKFYRIPVFIEIDEDVSSQYVKVPTKHHWGGPRFILSSRKELEPVTSERLPVDQIFVTKTFLLSVENDEPVLHAIGSYRPAKWRDRFTWGCFKFYINLKGPTPTIRQQATKGRTLPLSCVTTACLSANGAMMAVLSNDEFLVLRTSDHRTLYRICRGPIGVPVDSLPSTCCAFVNNDTCLAVGCGDFTIAVAVLRPTRPFTILTRGRNLLMGAYASPLRVVVRVMKGLSVVLSSCLATYLILWPYRRIDEVV